MATWMEKAGMTTSAAQQKEILDFPLKTTTGSEAPRYVAFWTSEKHLQIFAQELSKDPLVAAMLPLPPSSTIVVEFAKASDTSTDLVASLFINDVAVTMAQCSDAATCPINTYQQAVAASVKIANITAECEKTFVAPTNVHKLRFD
jgi:hypothetical protein